MVTISDRTNGLTYERTDEMKGTMGQPQNNMPLQTPSATITTLCPCNSSTKSNDIWQICRKRNQI